MSWNKYLSKCNIWIYTKLIFLPSDSYMFPKVKRTMMYQGVKSHIAYVVTFELLGTMENAMAGWSLQMNLNIARVILYWCYFPSEDDLRVEHVLVPWRVRNLIFEMKEFVLRPSKGRWEQKRRDDHMIAVQREQTVYPAKTEIYPDSSTGLESQHL